MKLDQPFVRLPYSFDVERLKTELEQFDESQWMAHPNRVQGNSAIPLISQNGEDNDEFAGHMQATPHLQRCEYVQQIMANFGEVMSRSRFMRLGPGNQVSEHVDFNYHWYSRVRIHIPITTSPQVIFYCGDEQLHMQAGECWIFDSWRRHNVVNSGHEDRVHLVIDTAGSAKFWAMVRAIQTADAMQPEPQPLAYTPGQASTILTERFNVAQVMAPGEMLAIAQELIHDFKANDNNPAAIANHYETLLLDLCHDWRAIWLQHGQKPSGLTHYKSLLEDTVQRLHPNPRVLVTASNKVGVNPIIMQRIIRAALGS